MFLLLLKIHGESFICRTDFQSRWNFKALKTLFHSRICFFNVLKSLVICLVWCWCHWPVCTYRYYVSLGWLTWAVISCTWLSCSIPNFVACFTDDFALIYYTLILTPPFLTWVLEFVHVFYVNFCIFSLLQLLFWGHLFFDTHTLQAKDFI